MTSISAAELPHVLVFSEGVLSRAHGTGTIFARNFANYPADKLENWFIGMAEDPLLPATFNLNDHRWPASGISPPTVPLAKLWNRFAAKRAGRGWCVPINHTAIRNAAHTRGTRAGVIYAIIYSQEGLDALAAVLDGLERKIPVILQIQDFFPTAHLGFFRSLRRIRPHIAEVWVVADSIARVVEPVLGLKAYVDPLFNLPLPSTYKTTHRAFSPDFRTVVLGNFWHAPLLGDLKAAWKLVQQRLPGLPAIRWHCHPVGIARVRAAGFEPSPEVHEAPFISGDALFAMLRDVDLAIIPFSQSAAPATDYERYSMPSRVTELAAAGLPIAGLTGGGTPLSDYLIRTGIGRAAPAADTPAAAAMLEELVRDQALRAQLGHASRALAEREFPVERQQARIYREFARIASQPIT